METKQKDIFRRLKAYSHGYYAYATEDEKKAYDAKIEALKARILTDVEHAPEIIAEEMAAHYAETYREQMKGNYVRGLKCTPEWKAIDNILGALISVKVLKGIESK